MRRIWWRSAVALVLVLAACQAPEHEPAEEPDPAAAGYDPDTLAWFKEGRPVVHEGQEWRPVGEAVFERGGVLSVVGEFEGMTLYAPANEAPPYDHLFFPYGNEIWQPLEPIPANEGEGEES